MEQAASMVSMEDATRHTVCGPDVDKHLEKIQEYADAGIDHIYIHQIGPDQAGFFDFYQKKIMPELK
jgi:hypothetical protein